MTDKVIYRYLLSTDGVNQLERSASALDPDSVRIDGRSKQDILRFLIALSEEIRFYNLDNQGQGDWKPFFKELTLGNDVLKDADLDKLFVTGEAPPHLALLLSFLKVYSRVQEDVNKLSRKRLNFYYQDVLKLLRKNATVDQVHVVFELGKNIQPTALPKGTLLDAGVNANGDPLLYALENEYVIGHAQIGMIMSSFVKSDPGGKTLIYKTEHTRSLVDSYGGWRPFGDFYDPSSTKMKMEQAPLGCAIASPTLALAGGERTITIIQHLTSGIELGGNLSLKHVLDIVMTTEEGWLSPDVIKEATIRPTPSKDPEPTDDIFYYTITIVVVYKDSAPSITAYDESIHQKRLTTDWPVWMMTLKPDSYFVSNLADFRVTDAEIQVNVKGLSTLVLQNDNAVQPPSGNIVPFGNTPVIGSNFYIGSEEAFSKQISSLSVHLVWKDLPESMATHYAAYENTAVNSEVFQGDLYLLTDKKWKPLTTAKEKLFLPLVAEDGEKVKTITIGSTAWNKMLAYEGYRKMPSLSIGANYSGSLRQGFVKLVLTGPTIHDVGNSPSYAPFEAFGHKSFSPVYANHAIQIALETPGVELPKPPYVPTLSSVKISYNASSKFKVDAVGSVDQHFQINLFGSSPSTDVGPVSLIPPHAYQGAFFLGFEKAATSQILSLLFNIDEGTATGKELLSSEKVNWSYLSGNQWKEISRSNILEDKTSGFQFPGLIRLLVGPGATQEHSLMPPGFVWLRASVKENAQGASNILDVYAQAGRASLTIPAGKDSSYDEHLTNTLPAESIKGLKKKIAAIKKVSQPFPSFNGRPAETDDGYYRRVHERIRHRQRALTAWDYERLLLEEFPDIYKVKAIQHIDADNNLTPGELKVVIVPDWRKRQTGNPLQPKANEAFLLSVKNYFEDNHALPGVEIHVSNPEYEALLVDCKIKFHDGFDPGFYATALEDELKRFLSPWSYDEGEDIMFGGKIHASEILAFIEGREYVNYVVDFGLYHRHKGEVIGGIGDMEIDFDFIVSPTPEPSIGPPGIGKAIGYDFIVGSPVDVATATRPDSILVSNDSHRINVLADHECDGVYSIGIGDMIVSIDFIVI